MLYDLLFRVRHFDFKDFSKAFKIHFLDVIFVKDQANKKRQLNEQEKRLIPSMFSPHVPQGKH